MGEPNLAQTESCHATVDEAYVNQEQLSPLDALIKIVLFGLVSISRRCTQMDARPDALHANRFIRFGYG